MLLSIFPNRILNMDDNLKVLADFAILQPRVAINQDIEQLILMWKQTYAYLLSILSRPPGTLQMTKEKVLKLINNHRIFIWQKNPSEILACVVVKIDYEKKLASFGKLAVSPDKQELGIGTAIVRWVENYLKEKNVEMIRIETYEKTPFLRNFYEKLGYNVTEILHIRGENILELKKSLK